MIDYDLLEDKSHTSISGGVATHSLDKIDEFKAENHEEALKEIIKKYGKPFIFDDRLELNISESESLGFYLTRYEENQLENKELKNLFPYLEEN